MSQVRGQVIFEEGRPILPGIRAVALDADLGAEQPLGSVELRPDGHFEIYYTVESFGADEAGTADVVVRIVDASGKVIAQSRENTNAPDELVIVDLVIDPRPPPTEWEVHLARIEPLLCRIPQLMSTIDNNAILANEKNTLDQSLVPLAFTLVYQHLLLGTLKNREMRTTAGLPDQLLQEI